MTLKHIAIVLLQKKMLGQVVFDQVVRMLDLLERDYFGLLYEDDHKTMVKYQFVCLLVTEWGEI